MQERKILCADALSYLPSISFFARVLAADVYLIAEDIQFSTSGFSHRTSIKTADGVAVLSLPVLTKGRGPQLIKNVELDNRRHWQRRHWRSIEVNYCHAAYFEQFVDQLRRLYKSPHRWLCDVNHSFFEAFLSWLQISPQPSMTSEFPSSLKKEHRLIDLAQRNGAGIYLCDGTYRDILSAAIFADAGIHLRFADFSGPAYSQLFGGFEPNLSMLDLLLNEGPHAARAYLDGMAKRIRAETLESAA
jgi:hypothetical protein